MGSQSLEGDLLPVIMAPCQEEAEVDSETEVMVVDHPGVPEAQRLRKRKSNFHEAKWYRDLHRLNFLLNTTRMEEDLAVGHVEVDITVTVEIFMTVAIVTGAAAEEETTITEETDLPTTSRKVTIHPHPLSTLVITPSPAITVGRLVKRALGVVVNTLFPRARKIHHTTTQHIQMPLHPHARNEACLLLPVSIITTGIAQCLHRTAMTGMTLDGGDLEITMKMIVTSHPLNHHSPSNPKRENDWFSSQGP